MHLKWHCVAPVGVILAEQVSNAGGGYYYASMLKVAFPPLDLTLLFALFAGSLFPDLGNFGYKIGGYWYGRSIPIFDASLWDQKTTRLMAALEQRSWWPSLYKALHSIPGNALLFGLCFWLLPYEIAWYFSVGVVLHLAMDYPTHSTNYLWWPFRVTRSRDRSWNWWIQ